MKIVNNWCKIFTLENGASVLFFKEYDAEKEKYLIKVETRFEIEEALVSPTMTLGYDDELKRDEKFDLNDIEMANTCFNSVHKDLVNLLDR